MKSPAKLLLFSALICFVLAVAVPGLRAIAFPLGLGLLIVDFLREKRTLKPRYRLEEFSRRSEMKGNLAASGASLIVSPHWLLDEGQKLDRLDGTYSVEIGERFQGDFSLISRITISRQGEPGGDRDGGSLTITAPKGWLLFLSGSHRFTAGELEQRIQSELKRLPKDKPLCLWLADENGVHAGIVVSTGEGPGSCTVNYTTRGGILIEAGATFIAR